VACLPDAALAESAVAHAPEEVAIGGVAEIEVDERGEPVAGRLPINILDERVLVDARAAAVGRNAVAHDVTDAIVLRAGHVHHARGNSVDVGDAERGGGAELGAGRGLAVGAGEELERLAHGGGQVALVEVPLPGDVHGPTAADLDGELPVVGE